MLQTVVVVCQLTLCCALLTSPHPRFGGSSLHQRDPRSALFENYNGGTNDTSRAGSSSPGRTGGYGAGYGYAGTINGSAGQGIGLGGDRQSYRPATPNSRYVCVQRRPKGWNGLTTNVSSRGQYSDAVLNELESQNDGQVEGILGKVRQLKDVGFNGRCVESSLT
jgi:blocked-early-in-transport protein 1